MFPLTTHDDCFWLVCVCMPLCACVCVCVCVCVGCGQVARGLGHDHCSNQKREQGEDRVVLLSSWLFLDVFLPRSFELGLGFHSFRFHRDSDRI